MTIDLAALRALLMEDGPYEMRPHSVTLSSATFLALLDRLAAAEAVVEAARPWVNFHQVLKGAAQAIDNYDRAIAGQQPRQQEGT